MTQSNLPTSNHPPSGAAASYADLRRAGRTLIAKIVENPLSREFDMIKAAKKLTVPVVDETLVVEGETDMTALSDFWVHEFRLRGQTMIERCRPEPMDLDPLETEVLRGHQQSRTSLFEVLEVWPREQQVRLRDVLEPTQPEVCLTDNGLSGSLGVLGPLHLLLFFRLIAAGGFQMTSGVSFVFRIERKAALLPAYAERMKRVIPADWAERKYVFFYRKHREFGERQAYQHAPGSI